MNDEKTATSFDDSEKDVIYSSIDARKGIDVTTQFEVEMILASNRELMGTYHQLFYYHEIGILNNLKFDELANLLQVSENTLKKDRDELERIGVISMIPSGKKKYIKFNLVSRIPKFDLPTSQLQWIPYLERCKKGLVAYTPQYIQQEKQEESEQAAKIKIDAIVKEKVEKEKEKARAKAKRDEIRFPEEDYKLVINAYTKYKGIGLVGTEVVRAKRAIKQMFLAQRSVKQIVDCMKFFHDNQRDEDMKWLQFWTIETVMKKIPEFAAGKLKSHTMDDDYPDA